MVVAVGILRVITTLNSQTMKRKTADAHVTDVASKSGRICMGILPTRACLARLLVFFGANKLPLEDLSWSVYASVFSSIFGGS